MKKTKSTFTALLVLAMLVLGIGYAAATTTLRINGTLGATADNDNFKVKFTTSTNQEPVVASESVEPAITTGVTSDTLATFSVTGFTCMGDSVVLEYVVKNESADLAASVTATDLATFTNDEYFSVVSSFADNSVVKTKTIDAQSQDTLYVTVTCIKTPIADVANATTTGIVELTATAVEAD